MMLRGGDPRDGRQRGSARGQMQKLSARKSHFEPPFTSFDHLVGEREQRGRNFDAQCLCGGEVDDQIEFSREFDRQVAGLFALENSADVDTGAAISIRLTWSLRGSDSCCWQARVSRCRRRFRRRRRSAMVE